MKKYNKNIITDFNCDLRTLDGCEAIALQSDDSSVVIQFYDGQNWNYLCSDDFTMNNAHAICHENFGTLAMSYEFIPVSNLTYGYPFYPYQHNCVGNEASLCYCPISTRNCTSNEAVAIRCQRPGIYLLIILYHKKKNLYSECTMLTCWVNNFLELQYTLVNTNTVITKY